MTGSPGTRVPSVAKRTSGAAAGNEIELVGVEKRFETNEGSVHAVARTDLAVGEREFIVLLGPSGCGKTTILRMMSGLLQPSAGKVEVGGRDLWRGAQRDQAAPVVIGMQMGGVSMARGAKLTLVLTVLTAVLLVPLNYLWWLVLGKF